MAQITITTAWGACKQILQPGIYDIPADLTRLEARCCVADGAGHMTTEAARKVEPFREPATKQPAPENKGRGAAPENKSEVEPMRRGRTRAEPDAGSGRSRPRAQHRRGE